MALLAYKTSVGEIWGSRFCVLALRGCDLMIEEIKPVYHRNHVKDTVVRP